jgi:hypothetical protein
VLTVCDLEDQDSSLSRLFLSNVNKCSANNIKGIPGVCTFSQGARGQTDGFLSLTELVAMNDCVGVRMRERNTKRERGIERERERERGREIER